MLNWQTVDLLGPVPLVLIVVHAGSSKNLGEILLCKQLLKQGAKENSISFKLNTLNCPMTGPRNIGEWFKAGPKLCQSRLSNARWENTYGKETNT